MRNQKLHAKKVAKARALHKDYLKRVRAERRKPEDKRDLPLCEGKGLPKSKKYKPAKTAPKKS